LDGMSNDLIRPAGCLSESYRARRCPTEEYDPRSGPARVIKTQRWAQCNRQPPMAISKVGVDERLADAAVELRLHAR
jgi:hypothetical protein